MFLISILSAFLFFQTQPIAAVQATPIEKPRTEQAAEFPAPVVTSQSTRTSKGTLNYNVTTGYLPINDKDGKPEAKMFFIAYTLKDPPANRPLMFSFNGGPGSSSVWLHMGAIGPKRVKMLNDGFLPPPPYEIEDNTETWLADSDLVFIDPIGTGFSRSITKDSQKFFSLNGDISSVGDFIRLYLTRYQRWRSPLYLVGESYGTTRAAGLSGYLFDKGIAFNGILLISNVMNFQSIRFAATNDLPLITMFPSYATTAWYHKKLPADLQRLPVRAIAQQARDFAANVYAPAMLRLENLTDRERQNLLDEFSRYTGLNKTFIEQNNFRIDLGEFLKELLRSERRVAGRLDSRFKGINSDASGNDPEFDPSLTAIRPPYTAVFNDYVRRDLGFKSDDEYYILGGGIGRWDWNQENGYADTSTSLRTALMKNPYMRVFIANGFYDMATPFFATEYTISSLSLDPSLRKNIELKYYEGGHMMYIDREQLHLLSRDASSFIKSALNH